MNILTNLSRMEVPILINWTNPFPLCVLFGGIFHLYSNFDKTFCKQTMETLIRRRVMRCLIWACTNGPCPTKRTLGSRLWCLTVSVYLFHCNLGSSLVLDCINHQFLIFAPLLTLCSWVYFGQFAFRQCFK